MQDERNTPQEEDAEEVEAHRTMPAPAEDPSRQFPRDDEDDDEVESHRLVNDPAESRVPNPSE